MTSLLRRDISLLTISIAFAFFTRFFVLFVGRPPFVGWFNHSPYYWVQSKSLIENNSLAYGDMPLLFVLYSSIAKGLSVLGVPLESAIIMSSRIVMMITPALIPVCIYVLAKIVTGAPRLSWPARCLVLASGFLPLTFANMPEHLQKNMLGLLLLAVLLVTLLQWLRAGKAAQLVLLVLVLITTCLTHLGSAFAALLLVIAIAFDILFRRTSLKDMAWIGPLAIAAGVAISVSIRVFDPAASDRVRGMLARLVPEGLSGSLFSLMIFLLWLGLLLFILRWFSLRTGQSNRETVTLSRVVILWIGLLAMPLWPGDLGMRLLLFVPLASVILLILLLALFREARLFRVIAVIATSVFALMSVAEAISLLMIYPEKRETSRQLAAVADKYDLSRADLIITPYGVTPIANWFLGTKGSLLTAVERDVLKNYDRVFVLNTLERPPQEIEPGECRLVRTQEDRSWTTRHDTPLDGEAVADPEYSMFDFYLLERLPANWVFDTRSQWAGWGQCAFDATAPQR